MSRQSGTLGGTCRAPHRFKVLVAAKQTPVRSIRGRSIGVRSWPIWKLPDWLVAFVTIVVLADVAVLGVAASALTFHAHHLWLFAGLLVCDALTVELTRRVGENTGMVKDVYATWELPAAMLAADGLRAAAAHRPLRADPVADPQGAGVPAGVQRRRDRAELRRRRLHLPRPGAPGARRSRPPGQPRHGLDAVRGGLRGGAVDGQPDPDLDRDQGLEPGRAAPRRSSSPRSRFTTTWPSCAWR